MKFALLIVFYSLGFVGCGNSATAQSAVKSSELVDRSSSKVKFAIEWFDAFIDLDFKKARSMVTDDLLHLSPFGERSKADSLFANLPRDRKLYEYKLHEAFERNGAVYLRYDLINPSAVEVVEYLTFRNDKIASARVYFQKFPAAAKPN